VSMIIDAAGGAGTVHHPHVKKQVHGEPERATLLKTKSTFVKVHGYGNLIVNNYYTGKQGEKMIQYKPYRFQHDLHAGANLVFDCVLRGLRLVYSKNGNKPITNLYIQLDNTNYNKGYGLLSALASLIQTGVVKKVLVLYLLDSNRFNLFLFVDQNILSHCWPYARRCGCAHWYYRIIFAKCGSDVSEGVRRGRWMCV